MASSFGKMPTTSVLRLIIQSLNRVRAVQLGPVLLRKGHVCEDIFLRAVHKAGEFRHFRPDLIGDVAPL